MLDELLVCKPPSDGVREVHSIVAINNHDRTAGAVEPLSHT